MCDVEVALAAWANVGFNEERDVFECFFRVWGFGSAVRAFSHQSSPKSSANDMCKWRESIRMLVGARKIQQYVQQPPFSAKQKIATNQTATFTQFPLIRELYQLLSDSSKVDSILYRRHVNKASNQ